MKKILVTGACGQLGSELAIALAGLHGGAQVIISDIAKPSEYLSDLTYVNLNVLDAESIKKTIVDHQIGEIYHLAAMLSASGEQHPRAAWKLNMEGLLNVLEASRDLGVEKVFWPSSIAAFGPNTQSIDTPQHTIMDPETIYGISKLSGELWCQYFYDRFNLDVRSLRYPGLISFKSPPGGGTTDYAVAIFHSALKGETYECFLGENTRLPMMYMSDAVNATIKLMSESGDKLSIRSSYNLAAFSVTPGELTQTIQTHLPGFVTVYKPDYRDMIAKTWPHSIDDSRAQNDWGWEHSFGLEKMVQEMITNMK